MDLNANAKAAVQLDAICDEYEQALANGEFSLWGDESSCLDPWLDRVSPEHRDWLREELLALQDDKRNSCLKEQKAKQRLQAPTGVDPEIWNAIATCVTFQPLSFEAMLALACSIEPREFPAGAKLLSSGEASSGLYLITAGQVVVMGGQGTQRHEIDRAGTGSILGEMSMITGHPCSADVIATTPVLAFVLPTDAFQLLQDGHPEIEIALSQLVSDRLGHQSRDALCGKSLGGFRLQRCISSGAMGVVYAAVDESDATQRALKMLRHRFIYSPEVISRFDQEVELLRQLKHPHVVSLRGHFVAYRTRFIVLDFYDGADLREVLRRRGPMPEATVRGVLGQIAAGLRYAHQRGVLHLDLKPANVLIDRRGYVAITDFGLGRLIESDGCDQEVVGTPLYMPPEQFTMTDVGPHCDWYSFGCIACELLTGERLFQPTTSRLMDQKFRVPSSTWPSLEASEELRMHIRTALQPYAEHRDLDLEEIAKWARPVPELAAVLGETPSFD